MLMLNKSESFEYALSFIKYFDSCSFLDFEDFVDLIELEYFDD